MKIFNSKESTILQENGFGKRIKGSNLRVIMPSKLIKIKLKSMVISKWQKAINIGGKYTFSKYGVANRLESLKIHLSKDFGFQNNNNMGIRLAFRENFPDVQVGQVTLDVKTYNGKITFFSFIWILLRTDLLYLTKICQF